MPISIMDVTYIRYIKKHTRYFLQLKCSYQRRQCSTSLVTIKPAQVLLDCGPVALSLSYIATLELTQYSSRTYEFEDSYQWCMHVSLDRLLAGRAGLEANFLEYLNDLVCKMVFPHFCLKLLAQHRGLSTLAKYHRKAVGLQFFFIIQI